jgi:hypothetical protein
MSCGEETHQNDICKREPSRELRGTFIGLKRRWGSKGLQKEGRCGFGGLHSK